MSTMEAAATIVGVAAIVFDLWRRRIPNALTFGAALAALVFAAVVGGTSGLARAAGGWLVGFALFFPFFALGGLGAGDVKLVAALGAWIGPVLTLWAALYASIAGGVIALIVALRHRYLSEALSNVRLLFMHWRVSGLKPLDPVSLKGSGGPRLAYSVPIVAGMVLALWFR
jgi:prepilin peptidase CpaA